ncbi:MAG: PAS domain-containing protein [Methylomonas sp.]|nr:PAS domain-containing protein [Methylomonas sp.]PPD21997.1 MAG: two-component sensor histidine kinase [Methylomonas sp.]PPD39204.1 MAG: two-component sensor histidine kinase [Methylomonas sp.]PPD55655.1 MAG: two-component sensor histidine kinase [Methylomonas sp.]
MTANDTLYPCPFSRAYGMPAAQAWSLLNIFCVYRLVSAVSFVMLFYMRFGALSLGDHDVELYQFASLGYLAISLFLVALIHLRLLAYGHLAQLLIFTDIVFITLLMHASGGVSSGVGALLAVSIAAASVLIGGLCALVFAALASLAVLAEQLYAMQTHAFDAATLNYSGLLGLSFFAIAVVSMMLATRVEQSALLARQHAATIVRLEELNRYIIQHLQSGILIADEAGAIVLCNHAALALLGGIQHPVSLNDLSPLLQAALKHWRDNPQHDFAIVAVADRDEVQVRFSALQLGGDTLHMLLFEDVALYNQRLQQDKLASLGHLTASIAHEIRNPLSAISHAGQLLAESPALSAQDKRLTDIIQHHCRRVNTIIEDILRLSRRQPSNKQKIALNPWLANYVLEINPLHRQPYGDVFRLRSLNGELNALIDPGHLKQIVDNLCSNALKYGQPDRGTIWIETAKQGDKPVIRVIDNGPGLDAEHKQRLFEPFFTTSHNGTGLGLYISRELAQLNQAELSYADHLDNHGFMLTLVNADRTLIAS